MQELTLVKTVTHQHRPNHHLKNGDANLTNNEPQNRAGDEFRRGVVRKKKRKKNKSPAVSDRLNGLLYTRSFDPQDADASTTDAEPQKSVLLPLASAEDRM